MLVDLLGGTGTTDVRVNHEVSAKLLEEEVGVTEPSVLLLKDRVEAFCSEEVAVKNSLVVVHYGVEDGARDNNCKKVGWEDYRVGAGG